MAKTRRLYHLVAGVRPRDLTSGQSQHQCHRHIDLQLLHGSCAYPNLDGCAIATDGPGWDVVFMPLGEHIKNTPVKAGSQSGTRF